MYLTGFADEAATTSDGQIAATKALGWRWIEARKIGDQNIHDLAEAEFDTVCGKLADAGIGVNCFGSAIGNWAKKITDPFDSSWAEARRAVPRLQRLGTKLIRIMSFAVLGDREPDDQLAEERFRRLRELQKLFSDAGVQAVHENCNNYGGMGWTFTRRLLDNVPGLKLVFDTGNPVHGDDFARPRPRPKQSSWEFYQHVKEHIVHVHIKDAAKDPASGEIRHTFPGEGQGDVRRIVKDLLAGGYDGGFAMEPHLAVIHHDPSITAPAEIRFANYLEYGRRFEKLLADVRGELGAQRRAVGR